MSDKTCKTCEWWDRESRTDWTVGYPIKISECKFMPAPIQKSAKDFCGQWKGREVSGGGLEVLRPQIEAAVLELIPKRGVSSGCSAKRTLQVSCYAKNFDAAKMVEAIAERINGKPNARFLQVEIPKDAEAIRIEVPGAQLVALRQWESSIPEGVRIEDNERIAIIALMTDEESQT